MAQKNCTQNYDEFIWVKRTDLLTTDINIFFSWANDQCPILLADASHAFQIHVFVRILSITISQ